MSKTKNIYLNEQNNDNNNKKNIVFLSITDWANVSNILSEGINKYSKNYNSNCICLYPHGFGYKHELDLITKNNIDIAIKLIKNSDIIIYA
jgi:hypothetical protein